MGFYEKNKGKLHGYLEGNQFNNRHYKVWSEQEKVEEEEEFEEEKLNDIRKPTSIESIAECNCEE